MILTRPHAFLGKCASVAVALVVVASGLATVNLSGQPQFPPTNEPPSLPDVDMPGVMDNLEEEVIAAVVRLPIAAGLAAVLALRPRRRGTPIRQPSVIHTQIVLAVVGALIMLVVGTSLARAFGIVGIASLIRYRSKIDDPKDAVVMLCTLAIGLAAGVGLYGLALFGALFIFVALWVIEGFQPQVRVFDLSVKLGDNTARLRPRIEQVLRRFKTEYELRGQSEDEVSYQVTVPLEFQTDRMSNALTALVASDKGAVEFKERAAAKKQA